jgi:hypothetical protein
MYYLCAFMWHFFPLYVFVAVSIDLIYFGMTLHVAQADLKLLHSNHPPVSAFQIPGSTGMYHSIWLSFVFFKDTHVGLGLTLMTTSQRIYICNNLLSNKAVVTGVRTSTYEFGCVCVWVHNSIYNS